MNYKPISLNNEFNVEKLYTIHYFEYMNDFSFQGESHNFWEFLYVDKGAVEITAGSFSHRLEKGDIVFHQPNEFHKVTADGKIAPNLIVVSFECHSPHMDFFRHKILRLDETERSILGIIISEARETFDGRLDDPYQEEMHLKSSTPFGSLQIIRIALERFLIHIIRRYHTPYTAVKSNSTKFLKTTKQKGDQGIFSRVTDYLNIHLDEKLTIEKICKDNLIGRSQLQKIFQEQSGLGIIEYFSHMKIEAAKQMMRTDHLNFTQISEKLGYSSIHYFSRQFKKITGMTPSEYISSIKALSDKE